MPRHPAVDPDEQTFFRLIKAYLAAYVVVALSVIAVAAWATVKLVNHFTGS